MIMTDAPGVRSPYQTMVQIVYQHLLDAIVRGELRPGDRIQQDEVTSELGVSRVPLREALCKLEERGFVEIKPHRGAFIADSSEDEMRSLYFVRTLLESASAAEAAPHMDETRLAGLRSLLNQARQAYADGDTDLLSDLNRRFHLLGHSAHGNKVLLRVINDLSMHCQRYRLLHSVLTDRTPLAIQEHEALLRAWEAGDAEAASHWVTVNLINSEAALLESFATAASNDRETDEQ